MQDLVLKERKHFYQVKYIRFCVERTQKHFCQVKYIRAVVYYVAARATPKIPLLVFTSSVNEHMDTW